MRRLVAAALLLTACAPRKAVVTAPPPKPKPAVARPSAPRPGKTGVGVYAFDGRLVVSAVAGPAQKAGVKPGDRLLKIEGRPVAQLTEAIQLLKGNAGTRVQLLLERAGRPYEAVLERF